MEEWQSDVMEEFIGTVEASADAITGEIMDFLTPSGRNSPVAPMLVFVRSGPDTFILASESPIIGWLNDGTGIFNQEHAGAGPGGRIVPKHGKALHFKNLNLASALGFPSEDVFLASVRGIEPKFAIEGVFETGKLNEIIGTLK